MFQHALVVYLGLILSINKKVTPNILMSLKNYSMFSLEIIGLPSLFNKGVNPPLPP